MIRRLALVSCLLLAAGAARAAQPQFWRIEGARDFLDGTTEGLSVDSEGRVRLAPVTRALYDPEVPFVWCLTRDTKGTLYAGTGNDGKVFKIEDGKGSLFFDAGELEVHALVVGPDGKLYVGTSPDGKIYAVDAAGKSQTFYDPTDKYIWALAFDAAGTLYIVDLGNRHFEVLHLPGHSPGSIGLWEAASGTLFSGDAIYDGPLLDEIGGADIPTYVRTMKRLRELPVQVVHAGHDGSFGRERLVELVDAYLAKRT